MSVDELFYQNVSALVCGLARLSDVLIAERPRQVLNQVLEPEDVYGYGPALCALAESAIERWERVQANRF